MDKRYKYFARSLCACLLLCGLSAKANALSAPEEYSPLKELRGGAAAPYRRAVEESDAVASGYETLLTVDGFPVCLREFALQMQREKIAVMTWFINEKEAKQGSDFWVSEYGGAIPIDVLKQRVLDNIVHSKALQICALNQGIIDEIAYPVWMEYRKRYVADRQQAKQAGRTVYGKVAVSEKEFFHTLQSRIRAELILELQKKETGNHAAGRELYRKLLIESDPLVMEPECFFFEKIEVKIDPDDLLTAKRRMDEAYQRLQNGEPFRNVAADVNDGGVPIAGQLETTPRRGAASMNMPLYEAIRQLMPGQYSGVIRHNDRFLILHYLSRKSMPMPYEKVATKLQRKLAETRCEEMVRRREENARIEYKTKLYGSIGSELLSRFLSEEY